VNLHISAAGLAEAAAAAVRVVRSGRANDQGKFPVLSCCRLVANGHLSIYGTDLDTGIAATADCDVIESGVAVVDGNKLADIARKLIRGDVQIENNSGNLVIKSGRARFTLAMQSDEDFPTPLVVDHEGAPLELTAADVMAIFTGAAAAALTDDSRIYLAGVHLFSEPTDFGHRLCGVGADNTGLSYAATTVACHDLGQGVLVHRDTCKQAVNMFGSSGAGLRIGKRLIQFGSGNHRLIAKMIDATPTAWMSTVPQGNVPNSVMVPMKDFVAALERCVAVSIAAGVGSDLKPVMKAPIATLRWDACKGKTISVALGNVNKQAPAALNVVFADDLDGKIDIALNPKKLLRLLDGVEADHIRLSAKDCASSMRVDAGHDRFVVLGPMRDFTDVFEDDGQEAA
jgi:DNA polymerase III subunit beta